MASVEIQAGVVRKAGVAALQRARERLCRLEERPPKEKGLLEKLFGSGSVVDEDIRDAIEGRIMRAIRGLILLAESLPDHHPIHLSQQEVDLLELSPKHFTTTEENHEGETTHV